MKAFAVFITCFYHLLFPFLTQGQQGEAAKLYPVRAGGRYGYIDSTGRVSIQPRFPAAGRFSNGLALIMAGSKWGYIDGTGAIVIEPQFEAASDFSEGLAGVMQGDKWGYIDRSGRFVIAPRFLYAGRFSEGLAGVAGGAGYGYIDKTGRMAFRGRFDYAEDFSEGLAAVRTSTNKVGFINKQGRMVIAPRFDSPGGLFGFSEGLSPVGVVKQVKGATLCFDIRAGYVDAAGKFVIAPRFNSANPFSEGLAAVVEGGQVRCKTPVGAELLGGTKGYIDKTGKMVLRLDAQTETAGSFVGGLAHVKMRDGREGYIDKAGKYVWEPTL